MTSSIVRLFKVPGGWEPLSEENQVENEDGKK